MAGFERVLAVPQSQCSDDLYRQHQIVWRLLAPDLRPGDSFVYHWGSRPRGALITARVPRPARGAARVAMPASGVLSVKLVAGSREADSGAYRALTDGECAPWFEERMARAGLEVSSLRTTAPTWLSGLKNGMRIRIPVRTFTADYLVTDDGAARAACMTGVGRGKRFGCGLLQLTRS